MKNFIVALCLIGAVIAHPDKKGGHENHGQGNGHGNHSDWITKIAGCENAAAVKGIKASDCCKPLPEVFSEKDYEKCEKSCEKTQSVCCKDDCVLKNGGMVDAAGKFDAVKAKEVLKNLVKDAGFKTDAIVDDCVNAAPNQVQQWTDRIAKMNGTTKYDIKSCSNPENHVIAKCIRRNIILNCTNWASTDNCKALMTFAKSCPVYPIQGNCGKHHKGEKKEKEAKEAKGGKKTTAKP